MQNSRAVLESKSVLDIRVVLNSRAVLDRRNVLDIRAVLDSRAVLDTKSMLDIRAVNGETLGLVSVSRLKCTRLSDLSRSRVKM